MAKWIEVLFGADTLRDPIQIVLDGGLGLPTGRKGEVKEMVAHCTIYKYDCSALLRFTRQMAPHSMRRSLIFLATATC